MSVEHDPKTPEPPARVLTRTTNAWLRSVRKYRQRVRCILMRRDMTSTLRQALRGFAHDVGLDIAPRATRLALADAMAVTVTGSLLIDQVYHFVMEDGCGGWLPNSFVDTELVDASPAWIVELVDASIGMLDVFAHNQLESLINATQRFGAAASAEGFLEHACERLSLEFEGDNRSPRGVYFTPRPLAGHLLASLDRLRDPADDRIVFDPATGSGLFFDVAIERAADQGGTPAVEALLPRLVGCELLLSNYVLAHLVLGHRLAAEGIEIRGSNRLKLFRANALDLDLDCAACGGQASERSDRAAIGVAGLAEALAGSRPIDVIGNPPWSGLSSNMQPHHRRWMERYRAADERKPRNPLQREKNLNDDYVKFIGLGQALVERAPAGTLALVANHAWLDGEYHAGLRRSLAESFDSLWTLDLHGNLDKRERAPGGLPDENVFGISTGAALLVAVRTKPRVAGSERSDGPEGSTSPASHIHTGDLRGDCDQKLRVLSDHTIDELTQPIDLPEPGSPFRVATEASRAFATFTPITAYLPDYSAATETGFDALLIAFERQELIDRVQQFAISAEHPLRQAAMQLPKGLARRLAQASERLDPKHPEQYVRRIQFRPWDYRWAWLKPDCLKTHAFANMQRLSPERPGLATTARSQGRFAARSVGGFFAHKLLQGYDRSLVFPAEELDEQSFYLLVAQLHSATYADRFADSLRTSLPRIPPRPRSSRVRKSLVALGEEIVRLELADPAEEVRICTDDLRALFPCDADDLVCSRRAVRYDASEQACYVSENIALRHVRPEATALTVGSYGVFENWARQRDGRRLRGPEIDELRRVLWLAGELARCMQAVDEAQR